MEQQRESIQAESKIWRFDDGDLQIATYTTK